MRTIYDFVLFIYYSGIRIAAFFGNQKAKLWIQGRKNWDDEIKNSLSDAGKNRVWIHCASLGEFEQGRPLIEKLKSADPSLSVILSFFSPSGFELRKKYTYADVVCYLPLDTKRNARKFIELVSPCYILFIKYEFWLHYFEEAKIKNVPLYMVSAIFRPSQVFFRWYGSFFKNVLRNVNHFYVQDEDSAVLLSGYGFKNTSVTGDTRFDRVHKILSEENKITLLEKFKQKQRIFIAGSTWPEDEDIFFHAIGILKKNNFKIIIAPHEVNENRIQEITKKLSGYFSPSEIIRYTSGAETENASVLIIDTIGILSSAYRYGTIAWIGGGFGKGIHNILEAAAFGLPVIFGPVFKKFREAIELKESGGAFSVSNISEAVNCITELVNDEPLLKRSSAVSASYTNSRTGATEKIFSSLQVLNSKPG